MTRTHQQQPSAHRGWLLAIAASVALALVSLASNITSTPQFSGEADTLMAVRFTVSKLANAAAVWAGLLVLAGWLVRCPGPAMAFGIMSGVLALVVHYAVGSLLGMFAAEDWTSNAYWFVVAVVVGGPLGLVGAIARRTDGWGWAARLTVPAAFAVEPFHAGMFTNPAIMPWPDRISSVVAGMVLLAIGAIGVAAVLAAAVAERRSR